LLAAQIARASQIFAKHDLLKIAAALQKSKGQKRQNILGRQK
jgi:hypothetical protein